MGKCDYGVCAMNKLTVPGVAGDGSFLCNRLAREHCELD